MLSSDVWLQWSSGSLASELSHMGVSLRGVGAIELAGAPVSIFSSLSSSTTTSESCYKRLSLTMETSLVFPSSNPGGDVSGSGLPSTVEPPHLSCSSF